MILAKGDDPAVDCSDKDRPVYILGSAPDLNTLPIDFWRSWDIIGMNSVWKHENAKGNLDFWIAHDAVIPFLEFLRDDQCTAIRFIYDHYKLDFRLPRNIHNCFLYRPCPLPLRRNYHEGICGLGYTVIAAISLAYSLGYKDIRMRGIRFGGDRGVIYYNATTAEKKQEFIDSLEAIYDHQLGIIREKILPELSRLGVRLVNETPGAPPFALG